MWPEKHKMQLYKCRKCKPSCAQVELQCYICSNDISGVVSVWHLSTPSKISALEIRTDTDDIPLFLISQFLFYIHHMGLNL
jgi:hypothetical protein